ncbi:unnamed protein product (macronuclear) [Paramecium tetraurelia]|uniref:Uncharacterized protein n=1 Tax=Paramecium tetraurelia TaxID=5888 RepID=A0BH75_PARTE|nr:uncharacterized protein GSPATT00028927001 [Paramecium tetraurelia]CAK57892.1 unnamed protein product [Paramecium tetraurelia]|eukprot:XP_001425290.1 hypothetical protein (macronuclear) [Paramecium tetraurelia strain d4-2]
MQQEEKETKKKATQKIEYLFPGMYNDEYLGIYQAKKNKYKKIQYKIPSTVIDDYDRKICRFEDKLTKVAMERQSLIRTPNKKEILNKIINQIQTHLLQKERELFEKSHCDTPVAQLEKKKSQFFQAKQHLQLLETMGFKLVEQGTNRMNTINPKQVHSQPCTPKKSQPRSQSIQNVESQLKEDNKNQSSERIERIQSKVNQQMARLGLKSLNISPDSIPTQRKPQKQIKRTKSQSPIKSEISQPIHQNFDSIAKKPQVSLFKKFQLKLDQELQKPQDIKGVINYCNTERLDLKNLTKDIQKKKRVQFRKFRIIQKELSTVGELGFEGLKNKYFQ